MALIKCAECGDTVSDKATSCRKCGYELNNKVERKCEDCDTPLNPKDKICNTCGCPVNKKEIKNNEANSKPKFKIFLIIAIITVIIILIVIAIKLIENNNTNTKNVSNPTHEKQLLDDTNISNYLTVNLSGRPTNYSNKYYDSIYLSGSISASKLGSECENVTLILEMTAYLSPNNIMYGNTFSAKKYVTLDSGCNYNIAITETASRRFESANNYSYKITNVSGYIITAKKIVD